MVAADEQVPITIVLSRSVLDRVQQLAERSHRSMDEETQLLLERGIATCDQVRESADRAYAAYKEHLASTGQREPTGDEIIEQLRRVREEVANELYPD